MAYHLFFCGYRGSYDRFAVGRTYHDDQYQFYYFGQFEEKDDVSTTIYIVPQTLPQSG